MKYDFSWDNIKATQNYIKHNISFDLACTIFLDSNTISIFDIEHSDTEDRWISLGISTNGNLLVVVHTYDSISDDTSNIRIISARKATRNEIVIYKKGVK